VGRAVCGSRDFGTVAFGSEGGLFDQAGIPTVVCGPGSIVQAHQADEYVDISQLEACEPSFAASSPIAPPEAADR